MKITTRQLVQFLLLLCAFAMGVKSFSEPDLWWQIRTGQWILSHGAVPHTDVFSYTFNGAPWINIKWGFEVVAAALAAWSGPETVYLIQSAAGTLLFFILFRTARLFSGQPAGSSADLSALSTAFILSAVTLEFRLNGRPEIISYLLTAVFLYILMRNRKRPSSVILLLLPLQLLWANLHEAYAMGIVVIALFLAGAIADRRMHGSEPDRKHILRLALVFAGSIAVLGVNPYGTALVLRPLELFSQVHENKYTTELLPAGDPRFWTWQAVVAVFILALSVAPLWKGKEPRKSRIGSVVRRTGAGYLLCLFAFLYLAATAQRNLVFLVIALFPMLYDTVHRHAEKLIRQGRVSDATLKAYAIAVPLTFYLLLVSNIYYRQTGSRTRFGLEVTTYNNPVGAAAYVEQKGLAGKRCFSDYLTSSYLLWKLQPEFQTFIDLRDLDVFPPAHFRTFLEAAHYPDRFLALDSIYHFDYVVLFRPEFQPLHAYLYNDSLYACTYVDAVAAVYEKTDDFTREDIFSSCRPVKSSRLAAWVNHVLNPFYKPFPYRSIDTDRIAAEYYTVVAQPRLAAARRQNAERRR